MNFYLAPMEGITTHIFRNAFHRHYGGADCYYTPFLSNKSFSHKELRDILPENNKDLKVVPQILTNQPETFLAIAKELQDYGYREVNLNLGCPSGTVTAKKRGAGFLSVPDRLDRFLDGIFAECPLDISIKTRIGIEAEYEWADLLAIYKKYPIKELIVHPRYQKEFYDGTPHAEAFLLAIDAFHGSGTSLCYNGDITSAESFCALLGKAPSTEAVMVGRGALMNPEIFQLLRREEAAKSPVRTLAGFPLGAPAQFPAKEPAQLSMEKLSAFQAFHDDILMGYMGYMPGDQPTLFKMKELWGYMGQYVHATASQLKRIRKAKRISEYKAAVQAILAENPS